MQHIIKTLQNGARLLFVNDKNSPSVEISLLFKVGSRSDPEGKQGITHLLEHLNYQGTSSRKNNKEIVLEIENLGGQINAFTGYEHLGFSIKCPSDNVFRSIDVLFDLVMNSTYPSVEIEKEKKVILEEIKMYEDIPSEKARDTFQEIMFKDNNLGFNIAGNTETLKSISRDNIIEHKNNIISQDNLLVSVAGDFDAKLVEKKIMDLILKMNKHSSSRHVLFNSMSIKRDPLVVNVKRDITQSNIVLGVYGLKRTFKKDYALRLGNVILSGGMGSLLYQRIREDLRLVYYINSNHAEYDETGLFQVEMGVDDSKINDAVSEVRSVLKTFAEGKFSADDFNRAKNYLLGALVTQIETSSDLASWNAFNLINRKGEVFETKKQIIKNVENVTPQNVKEVWAGILEDRRFCYVNVGKGKIKLI